jgi:hypothetical protein
MTIGDPLRGARASLPKEVDARATVEAAAEIPSAATKTIGGRFRNVT